MRFLLPQPDERDRVLLDAAAELTADSGGRIGRESLRRINRNDGTDVATAVLYLHFNRRLSDSLDFETVGLGKPWMIAIVPGAFYREHPEIGGDGRQITQLAAAKGWRCETIPTASLGTVRENARTIIRFIQERSAEYQILAIALSKGSMDLSAAIRQEPSVADHLQAWINISGVLRGTMMADWLLDRRWLRPVLSLMCWRHGADRQAVRDMRHRGASDGEIFSGIPTIHVAGFPLKRHLSNRRARLWHRRFRPIGPNDSVVLLEDLLDYPGTVLPVWGADHYLKSDWDVPRLIESVVTGLSQGRDEDASRRTAIRGQREIR